MLIIISFLFYVVSFFLNTYFFTWSFPLFVSTSILSSSTTKQKTRNLYYYNWLNSFKWNIIFSTFHSHILHFNRSHHQHPNGLCGQSNLMSKLVKYWLIRLIYLLNFVIIMQNWENRKNSTTKNRIKKANLFFIER